MGLTLSDFCNLFTEEYAQKIKIYDSEKEDDVWEGYAGEIPDEYADAEVTSVDTIFEKTDIITVNVTKV